MADASLRQQPDGIIEIRKLGCVPFVGGALFPTLQGLQFGKADVA